MFSQAWDLGKFFLAPLVYSSVCNYSQVIFSYQTIFWFTDWLIFFKFCVYVRDILSKVILKNFKAIHYIFFWTELASCSLDIFYMKQQ